jgi:aryl-alcohol dehydrogenase-like predicted oxidoreductase
LYQFHHPDPSTPIEESWGAMADLVDEGKVRWAGVSNFDLELLQKCENIRHVDCVQPELNLLRRQARQTVIPWCRSHGSAVIVYSPAASGLLTGGTDRQRLELLSAEDWRRASADRILELLERLKAISDRWGTPVGALAVAWTLAVPGVSGAICGARRPGQVEGWIPAGDIELDLATAAQIDSVVAALDF